MARLYLFVAIGSLIAVAVLLELQYEARHQLRSQGDAMHEQFNRLAELEAENIRLSNIVRRANTPLAEEQLGELQDLRRQVETLRRGTNEVGQLQAEVRKLRSALAAVGNSVNAGPPPEVPASDVYPRDSWTFVGYDTPEDTIESMMWAMSQGDQDTYAAGLTPELQSDMQSDFEDGSFLDDSLAEMSDVTGYLIVDRDVVSENEVTVTVFINGDGGNDVVKIPLVESGDGWKVKPNGDETGDD